MTSLLPPPGLRSCPVLPCPALSCLVLKEHTMSTAAVTDADPSDLSVTLVVGTLSRAAETRQLPSGDPLVALEVTSRRRDGVAESMPVVWVDAPAWAGELVA